MNSPQTKFDNEKSDLLGHIEKCSVFLSSHELPLSSVNFCHSIRAWLDGIGPDIVFKCGTFSDDPNR